MTDRQTLESFAKSSHSRIETFNFDTQVRINFVHRPYYFVLDVWPDPRRGLTKYHIVEGKRKGERSVVKSSSDLMDLLNELAKETPKLESPEKKDEDNMRSYTINSDASYNSHNKRGAWAYWIKGEDFHVKASGVFRQKLDSSALAELLAFEKGLARINERIPLKERRDVKLFVNTDCMYVIQAIENTIRQSKNLMLIKAIQHTFSGYVIIPRHVKAHTNKLDTARSYVNDWCDKAAKAAMKAEALL